MLRDPPGVPPGALGSPIGPRYIGNPMDLDGFLMDLGGFLMDLDRFFNFRASIPDGMVPSSLNFEHPKLLGELESHLAGVSSSKF